MVYKIDFINGEAVSWSKTSKGIEAVKHPEYSPRFYLNAERSKLLEARPFISGSSEVRATSFEKWRPDLSSREQKVLRVDCKREDGVRPLVTKLRKKFGPTAFRFYNVDFSPQFRFCLQRNTSPVPGKNLDRMELNLERRKISKNTVKGLEAGGEKLEGSEKEILQKFQAKWRLTDPDIVVVNQAQLLDLLNTKIQENGFENFLGRIKNFQKLAGENTVKCNSKTVHSTARYNIPGRIVVDRSNSFLLEDATLEGLWDLVRMSYRPMQELAWASIGTVLTSIEARKAFLEERTLTPWKKWSVETPKKASTFHSADRGGFLFTPEGSIHEDVYEADFASLFPNIMVERNISPETVCCRCCDNEKVPELGFSICENQRGFISEVLAPLIEDRQEKKQKISLLEEGKKRSRIQGEADAIKWLLVSCFGYMGHAHASYGAIKCHQAIQAFDRKIMLEAKEKFEENNYSIAHGIIDSIWVQKEDEDCKNFEKLCQEISEKIGIELEPEHRFQWCAFVPRSGQGPEIATLNRYFGKTYEGEFKTSGIEIEQRSTSGFVKEVQMNMIKVLDKSMSADSVIRVLEKGIDRLERLEVPADKLLKKRKVTKTLEQYQAENKTVSVLKRARENGLEVKPGQSVEFLVRDDDAEPLERTRLGFEARESDYDVDFYRKELIRATESILSPLGLDREDIRRRLSTESGTTLKRFRA